MRKIRIVFTQRKVIYIYLRIADKQNYFIQAAKNRPTLPTHAGGYKKKFRNYELKFNYLELN